MSSLRATAIPIIAGGVVAACFVAFVKLRRTKAQPSADKLELPVLDCSLLEQGPEGVARFSAELNAALESVGFFFLTKHGVDQTLIDAIFSQTANFHALPTDAKMRLQINDQKAGYMPFGGSIRKGYSKPSGRAALNFRFNAMPPVDNQWAGDAVAGLDETVRAYVKAVDGLVHRLLHPMAVALGLPADAFADAFAGAECAMVMSHYPDPARRSLPLGDMGIAAHTDSGIFTLIAQQDKPGLELCLPDGRWERPQSLPGAFLVNAGDMLRRWTNHRYMSALHRVVNLPGQERYAVPLFWALRPDAVMDTLPTCSDAANPPRYEPITSSEFMRGWYAGEHTSMRTLTPAQVQAATEDGGFKLMLA